MTDQLFGISAPVFTVGGRAAASMGRDCVGLQIDQGIDGLKTLRAQLVAVGAGATGPPAPMMYLDGRTVDFGSALQVAIGPAQAQRVAFEGVVSALEAVFSDGQPPYVVLSAEDALMRMRMTRRMRTYRDVTDAQIATSLAEEHGLQVDVDLDGPRYDVVQQFNQSDLAFLRDRARRLQAELWCTGSTLHMSARARRDGTELTLVQGNQLLSVRLSADLAHQRSEVVVTGYDAGRAEGIEERAGAEVVDAEISGGRTGARILQQALGAAASFRVRDVALTGQEAGAWARAEMLRRARAFVTVAGSTRGSPDMVVGSRLTLSCVGGPFEGSGYYVTHVRHTFDLAHGLRTDFEAERATVNEAA
ncbi:phage protein D [Arthrobacter ginsengisoli]|uniref:Phage protein D n=1 Tax=Arthrobacter ginsengisoli TaxID=1356565 RepID=A0ABU1U7D7_9MICC|nr:contractile injection system protein, VgrG/Pvc8 family [Arthrobacter ginsengisoli]MDR7081025.1 phage protein D [Arthrobacter ginsengisoli]